MKLADISIRRAVLASVMNLVLIVVGLLAYPKIGVDLFPSVEFPVLTVLTIYPGADPGAVEQKVIDKLEERLNTLSGLKSMRSTSLENVGQLVLEFELERNADQAAQDVRDKVSAVLPELPPDLEPPSWRSSTSAPRRSCRSPLPALGTRELTRIADDVIKARLQKITGVGSIDIVGGRDREVHVWVDRERLGSLRPDGDRRRQRAAAQNLEVPGGRVEVGGQELTVKTKGEVKLGRTARRAHPHGRGRRAHPRRRRRPHRGRRRRGPLGVECRRQPAVSLVIRKQSGANTVRWPRRSRPSWRPSNRSSQGSGRRRAHRQQPLHRRVDHDVKFDLLFGAILTVLIILFFLHDWRATIISAIALPTSVVATFGFIQAMGFTFNNMTMLGLTLSIGILIDDAIVVIENIHRHLMMGKGPWRAAREATAEIGLAVIAITASILAVFVPVATMKGIIGRFFYQFGLTVAFAVAVSLLVSFTLTPMLSARYLKADHGEGNALVRGINRMLGGVENAYRATLTWALNWRWATMGIATLVFFASIALLGKTPKEFLPPEDRGELLVKFELPPGGSLEATKAFGEAIAGKLKTMPGVSSQFTTVGGGTPADDQRRPDPRVAGGSSRAHLHHHAGHRLRPRSDRHAEAQHGLRRARAGRRRRRYAVPGAPVQHPRHGLRPAQRLGHEDRREDARRRWIRRHRLHLPRRQTRAVGAHRPRACRRSGHPRGRRGQHGAHAHRRREGHRAAALRRPHRCPRAPRGRPAQGRGDLSSIQVRAASGALVPLSQVVKVERSTGPAQIERQNRLRQVTVLANLNGKVMGDALPEIEGFAKEVVPPDLTTDWVGRAQAMQESAGYMGQALLLAIILVYLILAAQFESFVHPLTIMFSLPLATIGAFGALFLTQMSLNIFSMIGVIMLMGLVTKNAVLVVDYANTLRAQGMSKTEALLAAGPGATATHPDDHGRDGVRHVPRGARPLPGR
jgi:HAE1 family hydrophobic/amphiphilic exporter-1